MALKVFHKGLILVVAPLIIEIVLIFALAYLLSESDKESLRKLIPPLCGYRGKASALTNDSLVAALSGYQSNPSDFLQLYDSSRKKMEERREAIERDSRSRSPG